MTATMPARFYNLCKFLARAAISPFWRYVWVRIDKHVAPRNQNMSQMQEQLTFTLRAFGAQLAALQGIAPVAANGVAGAAPSRVSILIPTDTRVAATENLLHCLQYLDGPDFEVIVIRGPTENGMTEMLAKWEGSIKLAHNPERNISISRNLGAAMASGDIIALIDDDGLPEPNWLLTFIKAFENPQTGAVGGAEIDHTGTVYSHPYRLLNRLGRMVVVDEKTVNLSFPYSFYFPFARGLNSAYRREAFFAAGGFDEEYEYYYDEADLVCRLVDAGWHIKHLPDAIVHHKALPSHLRGDNRIMRDWYSTLKAKLYFSLVNNKGHYPVAQAIADWQDYFESSKLQLVNQSLSGELTGFDFQKLDEDAKRGFADGLRHGLSGRRRLIQPKSLQAGTFLPFPRKLRAPIKKSFVIGCFTGADIVVACTCATQLGEAGHQVNLVIPADGLDRIDFETSLWVHRFGEPETALIHVIDHLPIDFVYLLNANAAHLANLQRCIGTQQKLGEAFLQDLGEDPYLKQPAGNWTKLALTGNVPHSLTHRSGTIS